MTDKFNSQFHRQPDRDQDAKRDGFLTAAIGLAFMTIAPAVGALVWWVWWS